MCGCILPGDCGFDPTCAEINWYNRQLNKKGNVIKGRRLERFLNIQSRMGMAQSAQAYEPLKPELETGKD